MVAMARAGGAVVMVSSELPELLGMSDRVLVMYRGSIVTEIPRENAHSGSCHSMGYNRSRRMTSTAANRADTEALSRRVIRQLRSGIGPLFAALVHHLYCFVDCIARVSDDQYADQHHGAGVGGRHRGGGRDLRHHYVGNRPLGRFARRA